MTSYLHSLLQVPQTGGSETPSCQFAGANDLPNWLSSNGCFQWKMVIVHSKLLVYRRDYIYIYTHGDFHTLGVALFMDGLFHGRSQFQMDDWG